MFLYNIKYIVIQCTCIVLYQEDGYEKFDTIDCSEDDPKTATYKNSKDVS